MRKSHSVCFVLLSFSLFLFLLPFKPRFSSCYTFSSSSSSFSRSFVLVFPPRQLPYHIEHKGELFGWGRIDGCLLSLLSDLRASTGIGTHRNLLSLSLLSSLLYTFVLALPLPSILVLHSFPFSISSSSSSSSSSSFSFWDKEQVAGTHSHTHTHTLTLTDRQKLLLLLPLLLGWMHSFGSIKLMIIGYFVPAAAAALSLSLCCCCCCWWWWWWSSRPSSAPTASQASPPPQSHHRGSPPPASPLYYTAPY